MSRFVSSIMGILSVVMLGACGHSENTGEAAIPSGANTPVVGVAAFNLSDRQVAELEAAADKGTAEAAFRLAMYYEFVRLNAERANQYLERAANLDSVPAKSFLGGKFLQSDDPTRRERGRRLLQEAADSGDENAREMLSQSKK